MSRGNFNLASIQNVTKQLTASNAWYFLAGSGSCTLRVGSHFENNRQVSCNVWRYVVMLGCHCNLMQTVEGIRLVCCLLWKEFRNGKMGVLITRQEILAP